MTEHEQMVQDCEDRESKLTDWERGFKMLACAASSLERSPYSATESGKEMLNATLHGTGGFFLDCQGSRIATQA